MARDAEQNRLPADTLRRDDDAVGALIVCSDREAHLGDEDVRGRERLALLTRDATCDHRLLR